MKKLVLLLAMVTGGVLGLETTQATAHASAHVRYYQNIKNQNATVENSNAPVWTTGSLRHRSGTMGNYGTQVEQYYAAHIRKSNGKSYVYYKFRIGKKTGWVWHGYLKPVTATTPTFGASSSGNDLIPVANVNWSKTYAVGDHLADKTLMQMFPGAIYSSYLHLAAMDSFNTTDGVDGQYYFNDDLYATIDKKFGLNSSVKPVVISTETSEPEPFTKVNIDSALTKAGYSASDRAKYAGWYIGGSILPADRSDEGLSGGETTVILLPVK